MGNEQSTLDRAAEEAIQRADDVDMDRYAAIEHEESMARYREAKAAKKRLLAAEHADAQNDREQGEVYDTPEPMPVPMPLRGMSSSQQTHEATDLLLAPFNPRKANEAVENASTKAKTAQASEDEFVGFGNELKPSSVQSKTGQELSRHGRKSNEASGAKTIAGTNSSKALAAAKAKTAAQPPVISKGPALSIGCADDHRQSPSSLPKIQKRTSIASPQSPDRDNGNELSTVGGEFPPRWYKDTPVPKSRGKDQSNADTSLSRLKGLIDKCKRSNLTQIQGLRTKTFTDIRTVLHSLVFCQVTGPLLRYHRMLHDESGLPQLFDKRYSGGIDWPFDIRADAKELYNKWCREIFETDILRGIRFQIPMSGRKKDGKDRYTDSIDKKYIVSAKYHGNGDLLNGQWWPLQLCALRDGAHGVSQGGISGARKEGAYSCIMSGGHDYPDVDHGDEVWYCGTDSNNGTVTDYTQRMLESVNGEPIRLIRSHNLSSEYAPLIGFRYDGLYDCIGSERIDPSNSIRQRHRFHLKRRAGQDPIRGGDGPERRPTVEEVHAYENHQRLSGKKGKGQI